MARISIKGTEYEAATHEDLTMADIVRFPVQTAELLGEPMQWQDFLEKLMRLTLIDDPEARGQHPDAWLASAVTVWATLRKAGEKVTLAEAADVRPSEVVFVVEPPADPTEAGDVPAEESHA